MSTHARQLLQWCCRLFLLCLWLQPTHVFAAIAAPHPMHARGQAVTDVDVRVTIPSVNYYPARNAYEVSVALTNPQEVGRIIVKVKDKRQGTDVGGDHIFDNVQGVMLVEIDGTPLQGGREYRIEVRAEDRSGMLFYTSRETSTTVSDILAFTEVTHPEQPTPEAPRVNIEAVNPTLYWSANGRLEGQIIVRINYPQGSPIDRYRINIIEAETNREVYAEPMQLLNGQTVLDIPLPDTMRNPQPVEYQVNLYFAMADGTALPEPASTVFTAVPPPLPSRWQLLWQAVTTNRWAEVSIIAILLACAAWFLLPNFRNKKHATLPPPPITDSHVDLPGPPSPRPVSGGVEHATRLRLKVVRAPEQKRKLDNVLTKFPCTVGRDASSDVNLSVATSDQHVSRRHITISADNGAFYITDLGSNNGTFVNDSKTRLTPQTRVRLTGTTVVRLGPNTTLELRPEK